GIVPPRQSRHPAGSAARELGPLHRQPARDRTLGWAPAIGRAGAASVKSCGQTGTDKPIRRPVARASDSAGLELDGLEALADPDRENDRTGRNREPGKDAAPDQGVDRDQLA